MTGRRLPVVDGKPTWPELPGDYCGPVMHNGVLRVFYLKPNARDVDAPRIARVIHNAASPPHRFVEESDGTLSIYDSLGDMHDGQSDGWHGHLTNGIWRKC